MATCQFIVIFFSIPLGILSAIKHGTWLDHLVRVFSIAGVAMPSFWLGILMILGILVISQSYFGQPWIPPIEYVSFFKEPLANLSQLIWPTIAIGYRFSSVTMRMTRSALLEVMREDYIRTARSKGMLALESHIDNPETSDLFNQFPNFASDHHAVEFFCDYLRLMTLGTDNPLEVETLIDQELEVHHEHKSEVSHAVNIMAESFPGLGIVAAVLGVIHTMGIITEPPEVLGGAIGAALVGTFLGILLCYGFVGPIATALKGIVDADHNYYVCLKTGIIAHLQGYAPAVSVEFARKTLGENNRPSFAKLEETTATISPF